MEKLDWESFKPKFHESWHHKIRPLIEGPEMWEIYQRIKEDSKRDRIVPDSKDTFRAFKVTDKNQLKVIFYLQDPYPRAYKNGAAHACGIAMDCSNTPNGKLQPSLELFYDALSESESLRKGETTKVERCKSLEYLHEQGVMMLNTDLTCKLNKIQSHEGVWAPFQKYFLEEVMFTDTHVIYVLCGKISQKLKKIVPPFARVIEVEHPAAAAHRNGDWNYENIFRKINNILKDNNLNPILWNKDDWDSYKEPPF